MAISRPMRRCCWPRRPGPIHARWRSSWSMRCRRPHAVAKIELAGPGFINFHLTPAAWQQQVREIHVAGSEFGRNTNGAGKTVGVEYVSANPTGPLHVGHGRAGVIGDCIARVMAASGWNVKREFYYNDAGVQIENLARSTQARAQGLKPGDEAWPADAYNGDYIGDVADSLPARRQRRGRRPRGHRQGRRQRHRRDPQVRRRLAASRTERRPRRVRRVVRSLFPGIVAVRRRQGRGDRARADRPRPHLRGRRRAVAAHHRFRRRQGPRDAQVRRHLHVLRAGRGLSPQQVAARLRARGHRARRRPPRLAGAGEGRPAGAGLRHPRRAIRTTCCTRWSR